MICINQSDVEGRIAQILRMLAISPKASLVVIWLGAEYDSGNKTFDFTNHILTKGLDDSCEPETNGPSGAISLPKGEHISYDWYKAHQFRSSSSFSASYRAILLICQRPFRRRTWIVQEILASQEGLVLWCRLHFSGIHRVCTRLGYGKGSKLTLVVRW